MRRFTSAGESRPSLPSLTAEQIIHENPDSCRTELSNTTHFHVDLYEKYIPGLCAGLAFPARLLGSPLNADQFPLLTVLWNTGISGFLNWAKTEYSFIPQQEAYINKCDLCNEIRVFLVASGAQPFEELAPKGYYEID